jgi:hypothetical protein
LEAEDWIANPPPPPPPKFRKHMLQKQQILKTHLEHYNELKTKPILVNFCGHEPLIDLKMMMMMIHETLS